MGKSTATNNFNSNSTLHPPYFQMISDAISTLTERTESSEEAISEVIEEKYKKSLPPNFRKTLSVQLKKLVKSERLIKVQNSFKISSAEGEMMGKKTKRLSHVMTPPSTAVGRKMKRLSQVKTPEGFKRKRDLGKSVTGSEIGKEGKRRRK